MSVLATADAHQTAFVSISCHDVQDVGHIKTLYTEVLPEPVSDMAPAAA